MTDIKTPEDIMPDRVIQDILFLADAKLTKKYIHEAMELYALQFKTSKVEGLSETAEEILDKWITWTPELEQCADKIFFIKAMEEYANQFKSPS